MTKSTISRLPADPLRDAGQIITEKSFSSLTFWEDITTKEKGIVVKESQELIAAIMVSRISRLAIGEHLANIQAALLPYRGAWEKFLKALKYQPDSESRFGRRVAWRHIEAFKYARDKFPPAVVRAAMLRGIEFLRFSGGKPIEEYADTVRQLPPPENPSPASADRYLEQVIQTHQERIAKLGKKKRKDQPAAREVELLNPIRDDPDFIEIQSFRFLKNNLCRLPKRNRRRVLEGLVGKLLTELGINSPITFSPEAIPYEFARGPGKPKLVVEGEVEDGTLQAIG